MARRFTCAQCHDSFESGWTEEEARAEATANGFDPDDDPVQVCDDCYRGMGLLQALMPAHDFGGAD